MFLLYGTDRCQKRNRRCQPFFPAVYQKREESGWRDAQEELTQTYLTFCLEQDGSGNLAVFHNRHVIHVVIVVVQCTACLPGAEKIYCRKEQPFSKENILNIRYRVFFHRFKLNRIYQGNKTYKYNFSSRATCTLIHLLFLSIICTFFVSFPTEQK